MTKQAVKIVFSFFFAAFGAMSAGTAPAATELNVATAYGPENFQTKNLTQFAEDLNKETGGAIRLKVHPSGTLLAPTAIFEGVRTGKAEGGEVFLSSLAKEDPAFGMDALPFIVTSYKDAQHLWNVSRPLVARALEKRGLQLLYAVPWPPQNLYASRPLNSISDFRDLRMRTFNPATEQIARLVRATPVSVQAVDLENVVAQRGLDLMITSSSTGVDSKAWTGFTHYYKATVYIPKNIVFVNKAVLEKLSEEQRNKVMKLAQEAEQRGWEASQQNDRENEAKLGQRDMNVSTLDFHMRQYLDRVGENVARQWLKDAGPDALQVLLRYTTERSMHRN